MSTLAESMKAIEWGVALALGATGIIMALLSSLVGMRAKIETPLWWLLYAIWILVVIQMDVASPFMTILSASLIAGLVHSITQSLLLDQYTKSNPWYSDKMQGPRGKIIRQFIIMGIAIGSVFGSIVGGIASLLC